MTALPAAIRYLAHLPNGCIVGSGLGSLSLDAALLIFRGPPQVLFDTPDLLDYG